MKRICILLLLLSSYAPAFEMHLLPRVVETQPIFTDLKTQTIYEEALKRFYEAKESKAGQSEIKSLVSLVTSVSVKDLRNALGDPVPLGKGFTLPACYQYGGLTVGGAHEAAGESSSHFFPIGELGGIYVIAYEKWPKIANAAIYVKGEAEPKVLPLSDLVKESKGEWNLKEYFETKSARRSEESAILLEMYKAIKQFFPERK